MPDESTWSWVPPQTCSPSGRAGGECDLKFGEAHQDPTGADGGGPDREWRDRCCRVVVAECGIHDATW
jgi:hypothetical protein